MKILFLNHNQENFGTYFRCYFLAEGLSKLGHRVTMICASGRKFDLLVRWKKINPNFTIITLPRIKYHKYFTGQAFLRLPLTSLYVLFSKFDLLYAFTVAQPQIGLPALIAKKVRKKPLVIDWDDLWGGGFATVHGGIIEYILTWFERNVIKFADKVTYVSDFLGKEIEKIDPLIPKQKVVNGANEEKIKVIDKNKARSRLKLDLGGKFLLSVGNTYTKSFGLMLKAFQKAKKELKDLKLILVGQLEIREEFESLFQRLKKDILVTGSRPYSEIPYFLAAADVLILPMDDSPIEYARFPMRFGDYLCAQRPIVSNAVGEVKNYLEKYQAGFVAPINDYEKMAKAIVELFLNREQSLRIAANARKLAEGDLSRKKVVKQVNKLISLLKPQNLGVLILSPFFRPNTGGVETHLNDLCDYLRKQNHSVYVVTYQPLTTRAQGAFFEKREKLEIIRFPWIGYNLFHKLEKYPLLQFLYLTPTLFLGTLFFLLARSKKIDTIHAHGFTAALITNVLSRIFRGKRLVVSMHAVYDFKNRRSLALLCRWILKPFDRIFCLAEKSKSDLIDAGVPREKLSIYVQWVDQTLFKPRSKVFCRQKLGLEGNFFVLFVGRMIEIKGVKVLINIAKNFSDEIKFVFVGDGPLESFVVEEAKKNKNIIAAGRKSQKETALYFGAADVVVVPSQYEEGFARVVLEALSSGRPVIVSNLGCLPEMVTDKVGIIVNPTPSKITREIQSFFTNPQKLKGKTVNCRKFALERYSIKNAKRIEAAYF